MDIGLQGAQKAQFLPDNLAFYDELSISIMLRGIVVHRSFTGLMETEKEGFCYICIVMSYAGVYVG